MPYVRNRDRTSWFIFVSPMMTTSGYALTMHQHSEETIQAWVTENPDEIVMAAEVSTTGNMVVKSLPSEIPMAGLKAYSDTYIGGPSVQDGVIELRITNWLDLSEIAEYYPHIIYFLDEELAASEFPEPLKLVT